MSQYELLAKNLWRVEVDVKLRPTVSWPVRLGVRHPSGTRDQFVFLLGISFRQLQVCYFVAPSLTRGWVCNLLLLLVLASAVPRDSRPYFIVPILETPKPGEPGPRIYITQEQGGLDILPGTGFYEVYSSVHFCTEGQIPQSPTITVGQVVSVYIPFLEWPKRRWPLWHSGTNWREGKVNYIWWSSFLTIFCWNFNRLYARF
jgi:hypothetical protein